MKSRESESDFADAVLQYAVFLGWRPYSVARSDRAGLRGGKGAAGFPDALLVHDDYPHDNRMIAAEFKTQKRTTTDAQREWLGLMDRVAGCTGVVWRPDAPPLGEAWLRVETAEGADFGAVGRRLRGEDTGTMLARQEEKR